MEAQTMVMAHLLNISPISGRSIRMHRSQTDRPPATVRRNPKLPVSNGRMITQWGHQHRTNHSRWHRSVLLLVLRRSVEYLNRCEMKTPSERDGACGWSPPTDWDTGKPASHTTYGWTLAEYQHCLRWKPVFTGKGTRRLSDYVEKRMGDGSAGQIWTEAPALGV